MELDEFIRVGTIEELSGILAKLCEGVLRKFQELGYLEPHEEFLLLLQDGKDMVALEASDPDRAEELILRYPVSTVVYYYLIQDADGNIKMIVCIASKPREQWWMTTAEGEGRSYKELDESEIEWMIKASRLRLLRPHLWSPEVN